MPVVQWDFLPTCTICRGSEAPLPAGVDGGSLRTCLLVETRAQSSGGSRDHSSLPLSLPPADQLFVIGDYKFMRQLNSGEFKLFNIKTDYREQHDLTSEMPERVKSMDAILRSMSRRLTAVLAQVREALYDTMDTFGDRAKEAYK